MNLSRRQYIGPSHQHDRWYRCGIRGPGFTARTRFRSEVPNNAGTDKNIVLAVLACIYNQWRHSRPEVPSFPAEAESVEDPNIESQARLEYAGGTPGLAGGRTPKFKRGTFAKMGESATKTDPRRNCLIGKDVQAYDEYCYWPARDHFMQFNFYFLYPSVPNASPLPA